jgi:hypothetical protein
MNALGAIVLMFCLVFVSIFLAAFWARGGSITLRVLCQIILALLLLIAVIVFLESLGYAVVPIAGPLGNALFLVMSGTILVSGVVFTALGLSALLRSLRWRRWGHALAVLVLGGLPCTLFVWLIVDWLAHANNENLFKLMLGMPPVMLPLLLYAVFSAPAGEKRAAFLDLQLGQRPE